MSTMTSLAIPALAAVGGGFLGYALCLWRAARDAGRLADAARDGVLFVYPREKDGRVYTAERQAAYDSERKAA